KHCSRWTRYRRPSRWAWIDGPGFQAGRPLGSSGRRRRSPGPAGGEAAPARAAGAAAVGDVWTGGRDDERPVRLTFWGAARTVTGSAHLLEFEGGRVLLDCGLFQGRRAEARRHNHSFPTDPPNIDAVLLSHAHIDHSRPLPGLHKHGFRGTVYAPSATAALCAAMLRHRAAIQEEDAGRVSWRERRRRGGRIDALYGMEDAEAVLECFETVEYDVPFSPLPGLEVEYRDAGHILGSASMVLTIREGSRTVTLGFTGDVGRAGRPILRDPRPMADCDYLITESTYGGEVHEPPDL